MTLYHFETFKAGMFNITVVIINTDYCQTFKILIYLNYNNTN